MKYFLALSVLAVGGCGSSGAKQEEERVASMYDFVKLRRTELQNAYFTKNHIAASKITSELGRIVPQFLDVLIKDVQKGDDLERRELAAFALAFSGSPRAAQALLVAIKDADYIVRASAIAALGMLHLPDTPLEPFRELMRAPEPHVRQGALYGLRFQLEGAPPATIAAFEKGVEGMLKDGADSVRAEAIIVLRRMGALEALPAIAECLKDQSVYVRWQAAATFAAFRGASADYADRLIEALRDNNSNVVDAADFSLMAIYPEQKFNRVYDKWREWYEEQEHKHVYYCPEHPEELKDKPGDCAKCKPPRKLERIARPDQYVCPDHAKAIISHPGKCSQCGQDLMPLHYVCPDPAHRRIMLHPGTCAVKDCGKVLVTVRYYCADHPDVIMTHPGKCAQCQKDLAPPKKE